MDKLLELIRNLPALFVLCGAALAVLAKGASSPAMGRQVLVWDVALAEPRR